jgi:hypothetical protein
LFQIYIILGRGLIIYCIFLALSHPLFFLWWPVVESFRILELFWGGGKMDPLLLADPNEKKID